MSTTTNNITNNNTKNHTNIDKYKN